MKVLLIWPPMTVYGSDPTIPGTNIPLGLGYLGGYLEKNNFEVRILDALTLGIENVVKKQNRIRYGLSEDRISKYIKEFKPQVIGISAMFTAYYRDSHELARIVKKVNKDIIVAIGGAHVSINPESVLKDHNVDAVVVGEGEETLLELVKKIERNDDITNIPGTCVRDNGKVRRNIPRTPISNLDSIPILARHLLPMDVYLGRMNDSYIMRTPVIQMVTSRGCPGQCTFCSIHSVWGHKWRPRSAKNVVDEIESVVRDYSAREIHFLDDNMAVNPRRTEEICDEIINRGLDIKWTTPNGISHWALNKGLLQKMKKSGCYRLTFGIESGNIDTRKVIRKRHDLKQATSIIKYSNRIGLWTVSTYIMGFPCEDRKSIEDTIKYAIRSDTDIALFFLLIPFPGTEVYSEFKHAGLIDFDLFLDPAVNLTENELSLLGSVLAQSGYSTPRLAREQLQRLQAYAYKKFSKQRMLSFLNPLRLLRKIHSIEDLRYMVKIFRVLILLKLLQKRVGDYKVQIFARCRRS